MRIPTLLVAISLILASAIGARASLGAGLQAQLGKPTGERTNDPTIHDHYLLQRAEYTLDYNDQEGEPNWVSWDLTTDDRGSFPRSDTFFTDVDLPSTYYALLPTDYTGSGYDRGHMSPSADRTVTREANDHTFILSNILPQTPDNNQGVWANFENTCRDLAAAGNEILITSGGSLFSGSRILSGKAAIPGYTWKIVLVVPLGPGSAVSRITTATRIIAIKVPNIAGVRSTPWESFVTSVAQIESDTGYTFLTALPAPVASVLRTVVDGQSVAGSPAITAQPVSQTTVVGGSATFSVSATGDEPLSYQWFHDDDEVPGATGATLTLSNVQAREVGNYYVSVTNPVASTTSNAASLVILGLPPAIVTAPQSQTVAAGANVTFSVSAAGSPVLSYQWRKDGTAIPGATAAVFGLTNVQMADAGSYDIVVTNSVTSITSPAAVLAINAAAPTITGQPAARAADTGSSTSFSVVASGSAPLTYQWRKDTTPLVDGGVYSGTTSATLLLTGIVAAAGGAYDVVVTNGLGFATSIAATLTVNPPPASLRLWNFTAGPDPTAVPATPVDGITGGTFLQRNNNGTTTLITAVSVSSGYTGVSGGNNAGAATINGPLNKATSTYFEFAFAPPSGQRLFATGLTFGSRSTSTGPTKYDVYSSVDGYTTPVATGTFSNDSNWRLQAPVFSPVTGATDQPVTFRLYGYNGAGATGSTAVWRVDDVKLTIAAIFPPPVTPVVASFFPANGAVAVPISTPITVTFNEAVTVSGTWFGLNSAANGPIGATFTGGPTTFTLAPASALANTDSISVTIFGAQVVDQVSGAFHGATNPTFSFSTEAYIPPTPPMVTLQPVSQTLFAGDSATLTITASGTAPLHYQWRKGGIALAGNSSATTASLVLSPVSAADAGSYDCVVTNVAGSDVSHVATLTVNLVAPSIITPPVAQAAAAGGSATFTVLAAGTGPLAYQWRKGGVPLADGAHVAGAGTATLTLTGVSANDAGNYDVVVSNGAGPVSSAAAALIVTAGAPSTIYWDFTTASPTSGIPAGVTGGTVTQGNNNGTTALLTTTSASGSYAGVSGGNNAGAAARIGALNPAAGGSAYFEFIFTPPAGRQFAASAIRFGERSTGTGPQAVAVYSSVDGFSAPLGATPVTSDSVWRLIIPGFKGVTGAVGRPVTFRIFGYNGTGSPSASTANWRIDDLQLTGGLVALPATAPVVTAATPANGATNVAAGTPITVTFDQAVNVTGSWYTIAGATAGPLAATVSGGPVTFTLTPTGGWPLGDTITVTILAAQVVDQATGSLTLASNYAFSFATAAPLPPTIDASPAAQTATVGDDVTFTVAASGVGPLSYQWRKDGTAITGNVSATTRTLALPSVQVSAAGGYDCVVSNAGGSTVSATATLTVNRAVASVTLGSLSTLFSATAKSATATTNPAGLAVTFTYNGATTNPIGAGAYAVVATVADVNYTGSATGTLVISPAPVTVSFGNFTQIYDGTRKYVSLLDYSHASLLSTTYDGNLNGPIYPGSYTVVGTILGENYVGSTTETLVITTLAQVRHAPVLNGGVDGSLQVLLPEPTTLNSGAWISNDLLMPGTPMVVINGQPTFVGTRDATGDASPANYPVTLNSGSVLRRVIRRVDAATLPTVAAPPAPSGTRDVTVDNASQSPGDFSTLRNLTLNNNAGSVPLPPGTYGTLSANGSTGFTLGVAGGTSPVAYNLQGLTLNGASTLTIVGPVILTVASDVTLNGPTVGEAAHPEWLRFNVASGGLTLNANVSFYGFVAAPNGAVIINGGSTLSGGVLVDRLTINSNGVLDTLYP